MTLRTAGAIGMSAVALTAFSAATPAVAAPDCGPVPAGATLTVLGGTTCELDFAAAGSYTWTTPTGVQGLHALLVAGGSGAWWDELGSTGYAGNSGELIYADFSSTGGGAPVALVVGDGGASSDAQALVANGQNSSVTASAVTALADGGIAGGGAVCVPEGSLSVDAGNGYGEGAALGGVSCETDYEVGLTPAIDPADSDGTARPAVFADVTTEFGAGGRVFITADTLPTDASLDGLGIGAHVRYDSVPDNVTSANAAGGSGRVILRYTIGAAPAPAPALAATGVDTALGLGIAGGVAALGAALLVASRRQKKA